MMSELTFYGGVNEIGGNKILLEDNDTRIFFDFGFSFSQGKKYFSEFLRPRTCGGLCDYFEFGILPDIEGIYRDDYLIKMGRAPTIKPTVDGVFLTHAHADHSWNIAFLHKDMPIYCGETCELILRAAQESSTTGFGMDFYTLLEAFIDKRKRPEHPRKFNTFRTGSKLKVNTIEVEPIHVDHSIPGAYGFIIQAPSGCVVYTGDFRLHGIRSNMTKDLVERSKECEPDMLICEGTRIKGEPSLTEKEVRQKISKYMKTKGLVVANFPPRDIDRINTFFYACKENNRKLAITTKLAYLLEILKEDKRLPVPDVRDDSILIYVHRARWGSVTEDDVHVTEKEKDYYKWERKYLRYDNFVTCEDISKKQDEVVLYCDYFSLKELIDIKPQEGSCFIYSLSEPHDEKQVIDYKIMKNWLDHFNLPLVKAHASGHASLEEITEIISEIQPKKVIPIHTDDAEMFKAVVENVLSTEVLIPEYGECMEFT